MLFISLLLRAPSLDYSTITNKRVIFVSSTYRWDHIGPVPHWATTMPIIDGHLMNNEDLTKLVQLYLFDKIDFLLIGAWPRDTGEWFLSSFLPKAKLYWLPVPVLGICGFNYFGAVFRAKLSKTYLYWPGPGLEDSFYSNIENQGVHLFAFGTENAETI